MRPVLALVLSLLAAGCIGGADEAEEAPAARVEEPAAPAAAAELAQERAPDAPAAPRRVEVPLALEGNTGTGILVCVEPLAACEDRSLQPSNAAIVLEGLAGRVAGGSITLTWEAATPATQELSFGFMTMAGGEACPGEDLGEARGASPLAIEVTPATRPLCEGEVLHLWVAGDLWETTAATYHQVDVDQAFSVAGGFVLEV